MKKKRRTPTARQQREAGSSKKRLGQGKDRRERQLKRLSKKLNKLDEFLEAAKPGKGLPGGGSAVKHDGQ
jgi:hypothetical protein